MTIEILCVSYIKGIYEIGSYGTLCNPVIYFKSTAACIYDRINALWEWVESNKIVLTIIEMTIGIFLLVFGRKLYKISLLVCSGMLGVGVFWLIFYPYLLKNDPN